MPGVYEAMQVVHVHEEIEFDLEELQMMEEEEERFRKKEKKRLKRKMKQKKNGGPERVSSVDGHEEEDDDDDDDDDGPETDHRPSLLARFSNQFSPGQAGGSAMFSRHSATGPNINQARKASHSRSNSYAGSIPSPAQSAKNSQLERLMSARKQRNTATAAGQPTCGCTIS